MVSAEEEGSERKEYTKERNHELSRMLRYVEEDGDNFPSQGLSKAFIY